MTASNRPDRAIDLPRLHLVTNEVLIRTEGFLALVDDVAEACGRRMAVHLRGPHLGGREMWLAAEHLARTSQRTGAWIIVNDRLDVARVSGARGVQLGARSVSPADARAFLGADALVGASIHSLAAASRAVAEGADFLLAGTLFRSASHPGRPPAGTGWLGGLGTLGVPVVGIGGVTPERVPALLQAGAYGAAAIGAVWESNDPVNSALDFLKVLSPEGDSPGAVNNQLIGQ